MSGDSKNSSKKKTRTKALSTPFKKSTFDKAQSIAQEYRITIEKNDRLGFVGSSLELPTVFADAQDPQSCYKVTQEALAVAVATMLEAGQKPPVPASAKKRTFQVNIRLTAEEKVWLSNAADDAGFCGISDFLRSLALEHKRAG
jgi:predicted RNase H-like HicB family nuclease